MVAFPHCIDSRVQKEEERLSFFLAITLPNENPWTLFPIALPSSFPFYKVPSFLRQALTCRCKIAILSWSLYAPPPKKKNHLYCRDIWEISDRPFVLRQEKKIIGLAKGSFWFWKPNKCCNNTPHSIFYMRLKMTLLWVPQEDILGIR